MDKKKSTSRLSPKTNTVSRASLDSRASSKSVKKSLKRPSSKSKKVSRKSSVGKQGSQSRRSSQEMNITEISKLTRLPLASKPLYLDGYASAY